MILKPGIILIIFTVAILEYDSIDTLIITICNDKVHRCKYVQSFSIGLKDDCAVGHTILYPVTNLEIYLVNLLLEPCRPRAPINLYSNCQGSKAGRLRAYSLCKVDCLNVIISVYPIWRTPVDIGALCNLAFHLRGYH